MSAVLAKYKKGSTNLVQETKKEEVAAPKPAPVVKQEKKTNLKTISDYFTKSPKSSASQKQVKPAPVAKAAAKKAPAAPAKAAVKASPKAASPAQKPVAAAKKAKAALPQKKTLKLTKIEVNEPIAASMSEA